MDAAGFGPLHWMAWRVIVSPHIPDGMHTIMTHWTLRTLSDAHVMLDVMDALTPPPPKPRK